MKSVIDFVKRETVFTIAIFIAVVSMLWVKPDSKYIDYIDFRTIGLLFALMAVVAGFTKIGLIRKMAEAIIKKAKGTRLIVTVLWGMCFFSAMVITNDVALITFVPLGISVLTMCHKERLIIYTVVLQTVAANLGSMLTPMGNPQNLYIYNYFNVDIFEFLGITFPIIVLSFILLLFATLFVKNEKIDISVEESEIKGNNKIIAMYGLLGMVSVLAVLKIIDYRIAVALVLACLVIFDRRVLLRVDWFLLATFCGFFIFVGNIERIDAIFNFVNRLMVGRELAVSLCASQVISNVPAAVMLSGFTDNYRALILGTDIGGLGTLIASLASLISFKIYSCVEGCNMKKYLGVFMRVNGGFLAILILFVIVQK